MLEQEDQSYQNNIRRYFDNILSTLRDEDEDLKIKITELRNKFKIRKKKNLFHEVDRLNANKNVTDFNSKLKNFIYHIVDNIAISYIGKDYNDSLTNEIKDKCNQKLLNVYGIISPLSKINISKNDDGEIDAVSCEVMKDIYYDIMLPTILDICKFTGQKITIKLGSGMIHYLFGDDKDFRLPTIPKFKLPKTENLQPEYNLNIRPAKQRFKIFNYLKLKYKSVCDLFCIKHKKRKCFDKNLLKTWEKLADIGNSKKERKKRIK